MTNSGVLQTLCFYICIGIEFLSPFDLVLSLKRSFRHKVQFIECGNLTRKQYFSLCTGDVTIHGKNLVAAASLIFQLLGRCEIYTFSPSGRCEIISGRWELISGRCEILCGRCEMISCRCKMIYGRCEMCFSMQDAKLPAVKMPCVFKIRNLLRLRRPFGHCEIVWVLSDGLAVAAGLPARWEPGCRGY